MVTDANKPGPLQLPTAIRFFDKLITVCANLLFSPKYTKMIEQGCVCLLTAKCLIPQREKKIKWCWVRKCTWLLQTAQPTKEPQDCPGDGMWSIIMSSCLQHTTYLPLHTWSSSVMVYLTTCFLCHIKFNANFSESQNQYTPTTL